MPSGSCANTEDAPAHLTSDPVRTMPLGDLNMPPPFKDHHRTDVWAEDRKALRAWCEEEASP